MKQRKKDYIVFSVIMFCFYLLTMTREIIYEPSIIAKIEMILDIFLATFLWALLLGTITNFIFRRKG